jgi:CTP synthase (UTP-ammonia lyase)
MKNSVRIAIIGDYDSNRLRQVATTVGLEHAAKKIGVILETIWLPTSQIAIKTEALLSNFDAYFGAPGAVVSLEGTLRGIRYARESNKPYLGTCAGFQHAVLEFARNVIGIQDATSAEIDPNSSQLVLSALSCQIAGKKMKVKILPGTLAHRLYGAIEAVEEYYCHYGINSQFRSVLEQAGLQISAIDEEGEPRIVELPNKAFYIATLFVPQISSTPANPHPLLVGYLKAALACKDNSNF